MPPDDKEKLLGEPLRRMSPSPDVLFLTVPKTVQPPDTAEIEKESANLGNERKPIVPAATVLLPKTRVTLSEDPFLK